jgi:hypothetical protein
MPVLIKNLPKLLIPGFIFLWFSVVLIPLGAYDQTNASNYQEYTDASIRDSANSWDSDNPGGVALLVVFFFWPIYITFHMVYCIVIGLIFSGSIALIMAALRWKRDLGLFLAGAFALGSVVGILISWGVAMENFLWGHNIKGIGYLFSGAGLGLALLGIVSYSLTKRLDSNVPTVPPAPLAT